jgi:hypothetical protein
LGSGRVAPFARRERLPHVVMVAVMAYTMLGERSPLKCLIGAVVLIAASAVLAVHQQDARGRAAATTTILTAVGLALTLAFCG